jgi:hypothetical protein
MRSVHIGVPDTVGAAICWATSLPISDPEWSWPRAQSPEPGVRFGVFKPSSCLCRCQSVLLRVVQRLVFLTTDPEVVQQDRQFSCHGDDGALLRVFAATLG